MFLNKNFCGDGLLKEIKDSYGKDQPCKKESYELITSPFKVLKFNDVLGDSSFVDSLKSDVEKVELIRKNNDLYSLWQSDHLENYRHFEKIDQFMTLLEDNLGPLLEQICDVKFNKTLSVTVSVYKHRDTLLCHDDKCEDRCVAFVYYLTGDDKDGQGSFEMFDHSSKSGQPGQIIKSIPPVKNSFLIFEVGNFTYHQVAEVCCENFERLSINGWFHSDRKIDLHKYKEPFPKQFSQIINEAKIFSFLDDFINITYLTPSLIVQAQKDFEINSFILLKNYFVSTFYNKCIHELKNDHIWKKRGPANRRNYEVPKSQVTKGSLKTLLELLKSPSFINYLKNITGLDLVPITEENKKPTKMAMEVQKFSAGCYTMATDNDSFFEKSGLDMYLFFNSDILCDSDLNGGSITYLATDDDDEDNELLNIVPEDNALIMVYRTSETIKFNKYITHAIQGNFYCINSTYFEPDVV